MGQSREESAHREEQCGELALYHFGIHLAKTGKMSQQFPAIEKLNKSPHFL